MIFVVAGLVLAGMVWLYIRMPGADRSNPFELFPLLVAFILIAFALLLGFKRLRSARGGGIWGIWGISPKEKGRHWGFNRLISD